MLTGKYREGEKGRAEAFGGRVFQAENSQQRTAILDTLIALAREAGVTPGEAAIAWVGAKGVLPIVGPRTLEQFQGNLGALKLQLTAEQLARLDAVSALPDVFPYTMINQPDYRQRYTGGKADQFDFPAAPAA